MRLGGDDLAAARPLEKRREARSVADLQAVINRFVDDHNAHSKPFEWVANPDKIIAAVRRGHQASIRSTRMMPTGSPLSLIG